MQSSRWFLFVSEKKLNVIGGPCDFVSSIENVVQN